MLFRSISTGELLGKTELPKVLGGLGIAIVSTSQGLMTDRQARAAGHGGEIQLTDAMVTLMNTMPYHAHLFRGRVFDTGHQLGFLTANIAYALKRPDIGQELRAIIKELM